MTTKAKKAKPDLIDTHYRLPRAIHDSLRKEAFRAGRSQAEIVVEALEARYNGGT